MAIAAVEIGGSSAVVRHLVLFDIDGTLLLCGRQIGPLFVNALAAAFGDGVEIRRPDGYQFAGKTDPRIALDLLSWTGMPREKVLARLPDVQRLYFDSLETGLDVGHMRLMPGVVPLLERLAERDDVALGLLTGNWQRGAEIKLSRFDLGRFFPFGAYGDDAVDRRDLVPVAMARGAATTGREFEPEEVWIVGDSLLDVDCAQAAGARSLAVATGFTAIEELRAAGPDYVFPDLVEASREVELFRL